MVRCNETRHSFTLYCIDDTWQGPFVNCSQRTGKIRSLLTRTKLSLSDHKSNKHRVPAHIYKKSMDVFNHQNPQPSFCIRLIVLHSPDSVCAAHYSIIAASYATSYSLIMTLVLSGQRFTDQKTPFQMFGLTFTGRRAAITESPAQACRRAGTNTNKNSIHTRALTLSGLTCILLLPLLMSTSKF